MKNSIHQHASKSKVNPLVGYLYLKMSFKSWEKFALNFNGINGMEKTIIQKKTKRGKSSTIELEV